MSDVATHDERAAVLARRAKDASAAMVAAPTAAKDRALLLAADELLGGRGRRVLAENQADLDLARGSGLAAPLLERLRLDDARLAELVRALRDVAALPDPVGRIEQLVPRPSGIQVGRMCVPLGVLLMVYESRPNVTLEAAALAIKAGNAVILRGGKEALGTNRALAAVLHHALNEVGLPADAALFVDDPDRELLYALLRRRGDIDLAIPRGGTALIDAVNQHARVPLIQHYQGICHVYVHAHADLPMATKVAVNAKVQRPGVCNAMECLVVDQAVAPVYLPRAVAELSAHGVALVGCEAARAVVPQLAPAEPADFDTEFLSLKCAIKVVAGIDDALAFVRAHGSRHTEAIVTNDHAAAMRFLREVDASCVLVNASTRFNDGAELGLGAELGISTTKLHAYGPMGLMELCAKKFVVLGHGETRGSPP